jgi:hypothetical protein
MLDHLRRYRPDRLRPAAQSLDLGGELTGALVLRGLLALHLGINRRQCLTVSCIGRCSACVAAVQPNTAEQRRDEQQPA